MNPPVSLKQLFGSAALELLLINNTDRSFLSASPSSTIVFALWRAVAAWLHKQLFDVSIMSPLSLADPSLLTLLLAPSANAEGRTSTDHGSQGVTLLVRFMGTRKIQGSLDLLLRPCCAVGRAASRSATRVHGCWAYSCLPGAFEPTYSHCLAYLDPAVLPSLLSIHPFLFPPHGRVASSLCPCLCSSLPPSLPLLMTLLPSRPPAPSLRRTYTKHLSLRMQVRQSLFSSSAACALAHHITSYVWDWLGESPGPFFGAPAAVLILAQTPPPFLLLAFAEGVW